MGKAAPLKKPPPTSVKAAPSTPLGKAAVRTPTGSFRGSGAGAIGGGGAPAPDAADQAKSLYGYLGWFVDHPEVGPIIRQAAAEGWDMARLQGALVNTWWWQTTSEATRQWDALVVMDHATAHRRIMETYGSLGTQAAQLGISIDGTRLYSMAVNANRFGWSDAEMKIALAAEMRWRPGQASGAVADMMTDVRTIASKFLIPVTERQAWEWTRRMVAGGGTMDAVEAQMRTLALSRFPHLKPQIEAGVAPGDYFASHRNTLAELLERTPEEIDFVNDSRWNPVLSAYDTQTQEFRAMTLSETARFARQQSEWSSTKNAWETVTDAGNAVLELFGKVAR